MESAKGIPGLWITPNNVAAIRDLLAQTPSWIRSSRILRDL